MNVRRCLAGCGAIALLLLAGRLPARVAAQSGPGVIVSEVNPAGSGGTSGYGADWFELSNTGSAALDLTGWRMDDSNPAYATAGPLRGVASLPPGASAVFLEASPANEATVRQNFLQTWFGDTPPAGLLIGFYTASGIGLSTGGDEVNIFNGQQVRVTAVAFGAAPDGGRTFDNTAGIGAASTPPPTIATASAAGVNGVFASSAGEVGSPGTRTDTSVVTGLDLSRYVRVGRYDLPEPTRTSAPANSVLAQEVSAVTYNWDTDTLFVVGDGGTSVVQVNKTGGLINSMTLAPGGSSQGTEFYDPEGLAYIGNGQFVLVEERDRRVVRFTYAPNTTLTRSATQTVQIGTFVDNIGIEGITYDPLTGGFIAVKETQPQGVFQTTIDFATGQASNGSPTTQNSINLFPPALLTLADIADVFALSNLSVAGADSSHLLILSQEDGRILHVDRQGTIYNALTIVRDLGNPLSVSGQQHEGLAMDRDGRLYVVSENGGGDFDHPQLWVYAPAAAPNAAPTGLVLQQLLTSVPESLGTSARVPVADLFIQDDGLGVNNLTVVGDGADIFEADIHGLYLKAGTALDFETRSSYTVDVYVDDPTLGVNPDASARFTINVTDVEEVPAMVIVSEVAPWASGNSPGGADWFEVTNIGPLPVDLTGWRMDDDSGLTGNVSVALNGISSIAPGESVVFIETSNLAAAREAFLATWFVDQNQQTRGAGLQIGSYSGGGVGLSTGGDAVVLFDAGGVRQAMVRFGASTTGRSFDNAEGLDDALISRLSLSGVYGAFVAPGDPTEVGSPGVTGRLIISEIAPWASGGNSPVDADWFEVTNTGPRPVDLTGWRVDDSSESLAASAPLNGIASVAPGESVIFIETTDLPGKRQTFIDTWFGGRAPAQLQFGSYTGGGIGLSTGGDALVLFNAAGGQHTKVSFPAATVAAPFATFDNSAGLHRTEVSALSVAGRNAAFAAAPSPEVGSPGLRVVESYAFSISRGGIVMNRATRLFAQTVTIRNDGVDAVTAPIQFVVDGLPPGVTLAHATGATAARPPIGSPYVTALPAGALAPGASVSVVLQFANPSMRAIGYNARVLAVAVP